MKSLGLVLFILAMSLSVVWVVDEADRAEVNQIGHSIR